LKILTYIIIGGHLIHKQNYMVKVKVSATET